MSRHTVMSVVNTSSPFFNVGILYRLSGLFLFLDNDNK